MARLSAGIAGIFTALSLVIFASLAVHGLWRPDAFDYAQIARELVEGNGFSSRQAIYALHLRFLDNHGLLQAPWPNLHRFPLPSLAIAGLFGLLGVGDTAVIAYGILFHAATSALLFVWTNRAIGRLAAVGVVLLFTLNGAMLQTGCAGLAEPPVMFFFTLSLYWLWREQGGARVASRFCVGMFLGLAALSRTNILFVAPLFCLWILLSRAPRETLTQRLTGALLLVAGLAVAVAPWMIRNWNVAGDPLFSLHSYFLLPAAPTPAGNKWDYSLPWVRDFVSPLEYARQNPGLVWTKWKTNFAALVRDYPTFAGTFLTPLLALAALILRPGEKLRRIAWLLFCSIGANALLVCLTDMYFDKYYFHFLPVMLMLGVGVVWTLLGTFHTVRGRPWIFFTLLATLANPPAIYSNYLAVSRESRLLVREHMDFIRDHTAPDAVVFSDQSFAVTWMTGRRSINCHYDRLKDGFYGLAVLTFYDEYLPIDGVYLSRLYMHNALERRALSASLRDPRFRQLFPHTHAFRDGAVFFYR